VDARVLKVGPGTHCPPRHVMPCNSRTEGSGFKVRRMVLATACDAISL